MIILKGKFLQMPIKELSYQSVLLKDEALIHSFEIEIKYLEELDADRLLAGFRETAGLPAEAVRYPGWEETEIQGHTLGHYLTALAQAYGQSGEKKYKDKVEYILSHLQSCQAEDGFLFASPRELFDRVEHKKPVWVPWYTMHKIMEGIIAAYKFTQSELGLDILSRLGSWIAERCLSWTAQTRKTVLAVEYGGMNDCLYDLYILTQNDQFAQAAAIFDEETLFEPLRQKKDILNGLHANTTIPKIIGALKRYLALGEEERYYREVAENFWDIVVNHHTYITGGNSEWEHFGEPDILDGERTACNCETCNTYNMLKLTKLLFMISGDVKYAEYYEKTWINAILSSQNQVTGMTTYFQPMATGYFKVFGTPFDRFWCCTGTGMENFTKLTEGIYFYRNNRLYINRFVSSEVIFPERKVTLDLKANLLEEENICLTVYFDEADIDSDFELAVRIPSWVSHLPSPQFDNSQLQDRVEAGYMIISGKWQKENNIRFTLGMSLQVHSLPDNKNTIAFTYGPYVLSAMLGSQMMDVTFTGVEVYVPTKEIVIKDYLILDQITASDLRADPGKYMVKHRDGLAFTLTGAENDRNLVFIPHFKQNEERYGIYFRLYQQDSGDWQAYAASMAKKQKLAKLQTDIIPVGNDQYELAHRIKGNKTDTYRIEGHVCRFAKEDGWFSYELNPGKEGKKLCIIYSIDDINNSHFDIFINDVLFSAHELTNDNITQSYFTKEYLLPKKFTDGNHTVTVKFQNKSNESMCRIFDEIYLSK